MWMNRIRALRAATHLVDDLNGRAAGAARAVLRGCEDDDERLGMGRPDAVRVELQQACVCGRLRCIRTCSCHVHLRRRRLHELAIAADHEEADPVLADGEVGGAEDEADVLARLRVQPIL